MARNRYATVKIPFELASQLDELVTSLGYRSRAEIVNDSIRRFLEAQKQHEETKLEEEKPKQSAAITV